MDFSKYELSDELRAALTKDYTTSLDKEVSGLKNKNAELIDREKSAKTTIETMTVEAATVEENNKVALAESNGTVEQYKEAIKERDDKINSITLEFTESNNERLVESAVNDFSGTLADDPAGRMYMTSQFNSMIEVKDGVVVSKDPTKSVEEISQSLISDKSNAKYIKANVGSGLGSMGSNVVDASGVNQEAEAAKKSGDLGAFISASMTTPTQ